jgi:hypothetical protein
MYFIRTLIFTLLVPVFIALCCERAESQSNNLKLVFIRHAEKPDDGDNLNCKGINRSLLLPAVLYKKFGKPGNVYVPAIKQGVVTKRARMLETILPFVSKYNLRMNTQYEEDDYIHVRNALLGETGIVIIVWEHKDIEQIVRALGVSSDPRWHDDDFDSIWIVNFKKGKPVILLDKEGIKPGDQCIF